MIVKYAEPATHHNERNTRFHQPPGKQRFFAKAVSAVGVPYPVGLALQCKGFLRLSRENHLQRLRIVSVHPLHGATCVEVMLQAVELASQSVAVLRSRDTYAWRHP